MHFRIKETASAIGIGKCLLAAMVCALIASLELAVEVEATLLPVRQQASPL